MSKFIDQLVVGTATFILSIFLPKHFITLIRELIKFIFISLIRYWYITAFITGLIFFINYKYVMIKNIFIDLTTHKFMRELLLCFGSFLTGSGVTIMLFGYDKYKRNYIHN